MSSDINPMAYLNWAREYSDAANELLKVSEQRPKVYNVREFDGPISFLYFHAIELALKAFLRFHNQKIPTGGRASHDIEALYARCQKFGLTLGPDDRLTIGNIVSLLNSGNKKDGFRYFNLDPNITVDPVWTSEVIAELIGALAPILDTGDCPDEPMKITLTVHRPVPKTEAP
jgi:hypothetical protein